MAITQTPDQSAVRRYLPAGLCFIAFLLWAFLANQGYLQSLDTAGMTLFRAADNSAVTIGPDFLAPLMKGITNVAGGGVALVGLSLLLVALAWKKRGSAFALKLFGLIAVYFILISVLKKIFGRARPELVEQLVHETSLSFPSGHASRSALVYGLVALLLPALMSINKNIITTICYIIFIAIGISRVFLGVHWPSDVIGGWLIAAAWISLTRSMLSQN